MSPKPRSWVAVAGLPLIQARLLPCVSMVRLSSSVSSAAMSEKPSSSSHCSTSWLVSKAAEISARVAPSRTTPLSARAPSTSCKASIRIDLPAPVSPVRAEKPCDKSRSSSRTITKSRKTMCSRLMHHPRSNVVFRARCRNSSSRVDAKSGRGSWSVSR